MKLIMKTGYVNQLGGGIHYNIYPTNTKARSRGSFPSETVRNQLAGHLLQSLSCIHKQCLSNLRTKEECVHQLGVSIISC